MKRLGAILIAFGIAAFLLTTLFLMFHELFESIVDMFTFIMRGGK
jgi:hypothetical protein